MKGWNVASLGEFENHWGTSSIGFVVLMEPGPQPACLHSHDGIGSGIVGVPAVKHINPQYVFLDSVLVPLEGLLDNEPEEAAQAW